MEFLHGLFVLLMALLTSPEGFVFCAPHITPKHLVTRLGSPLTLNCSSSCAPGKVTWRLMQDSGFYSKKRNDHGHYSTLELQSVTEDDTSFICEEKCGNKNSRTSVKLYHFSGPNITTDPEDPQTGQSFQLKCEVKIHPELSPELKLIRGGRVLSTQRKCLENDRSPLLLCEVSTEETTLLSEAQYKCEATLQNESSERTESATLTLTLREAATTTHLPTETTPLLIETTPLLTETMPLHMETTPHLADTTPLPTASPTKSTASVVTKRVTVQTDHLNTQSSTAFNRSAAVRPSSSSSSSPSSTEQNVWVAVTICGVILFLGICLVLFFRFKTKASAGRIVWKQ